MAARALSAWLAITAVALIVGQAVPGAPPGLSDAAVGALVLAAEDTKRIEEP